MSQVLFNVLESFCCLCLRNVQLHLLWKVGNKYVALSLALLTKGHFSKKFKVNFFPSQKIKVWSWFSICNRTFLGFPKSKLEQMASSGRHLIKSALSYRHFKIKWAVKHNLEMSLPFFIHFWPSFLCYNLSIFSKTKKFL